MNPYFTDDKTLSLDELAIKYWTDKNSNCHDYCGKYERYLPFKRDDTLKMLELGIDKGGSLKLWSKYYYNSTIVGIDCDVECKKYEDKNKVFVEIGKQEDSQFLNRVNKTYGEFDFILDDCSHQQDLTIKSFEILFPLLKDGGTYVIEDVSCSYWEFFGGGYKKEGTTVEYFKNLIDDVNFRGCPIQERYNQPWHLRRDDWLIRQMKDYNVDIRIDIESILFLNSIIIIHKRK